MAQCRSPTAVRFLMTELAFQSQTYAALIAALRADGYRLSCLGRIRDSGNPLTAFVRHDVDFNLAAAVAMAEWESASGIVATYFISVQAPFFNVFATPSLTSLRALTSFGHELALHIDLRDPEPALRARDALCRILPAIDGEHVSLHSPKTHDVDLTSLGVSDVHTMCDELGFRYMSDSMGTWRGNGRVPKLTGSGAHLHLNTHPIWWYAGTSTPFESLVVPPSQSLAAADDAHWWFPKLAGRSASSDHDRTP
jgi:hypothetical protein